MVGKNHAPNRRTVLKKMAAGSGGLLVASTASASATSSGIYTGHSYDTLTQESAGIVTGNIAQDGNDLRGILNIAGISIPLDKLQMTENSHTADDYYAVLTESKFKKDDVPLRVTLSKHSNQFNGVVSRPGGKYGRLGFSVFAEKGPIDPDRARESQKMRPKWTNSPHDFAIPNQGIPTDTGIKRLTRLAQKEPLYPKGGADQ